MFAVTEDIFLWIIFSECNVARSSGSRLKEHWKDGAVLIVEHSYRSADMVRDSDNVELKQVIDLLHFLGYVDSDRGTELNIFLTCNTDQNKNETCLYLAPKACIQRFWD